MENSTKRHAAIRQFLLGQASEESAEETEERIFAEPDFAEEVGIAEGELIEAYRVRALNPEERGLFESKYLTSPAGRGVVAYEDALSDFVRAKSEEKHTAAGGGSRAADASPAEAETGRPRGLEESWRRSLASLLNPLWATRRAAAYTLLAAFVLLLAAGVWIQGRRHSTYTPPQDPARAERSAREAELARLNADDADTRGPETAAVTLSPAERNAGATRRVTASDAPDGLVRFRLNLTRNARGRYRALFLDDLGNELFSVSNLSARDTPEGPQLWLLVPARYLGGGDYQIALGRTADSGPYSRDGSYTFRVTNER